MKIRHLILGLFSLLLLSTATALADSGIENEFDIVLVSGPEGGTITVDDNQVEFSTPGRYVLRVLPDEPDALTLIDDQIEVEVSAGDQVNAASDQKLEVEFGFVFVSGPEGSAVEVDEEEVQFSLPGRYVLRVQLGDASVVTLIDDQIEVDTRTDQQIEQELEAAAATAPEVQVAVEQIDLGRQYLPLIANHQHDMSAGDASAQVNAATVGALWAAENFGPFDKRKIPVELQAWWMPAFGHIHAAALVPLGQPVSGILNIPIRIVMHHNPSTLYLLRIDSDETVEVRVPLNNLRCPTQICAWSLTVPLDTTKMSSGWRELRIRATTTTPDGKRFLNSSAVPVLVQNGGTVKDNNRYCNNTFLVGKGWYDGSDYTNAVVECVPTAPVKGVITFRVKAQKPSKHLLVDLDKGHIIPAVSGWVAQPDTAGTALFDKDGNFSDWVPITIDTTRLANGWHSLGVKSTGTRGQASKCNGCPSGVNFPFGVAKFWFYVQN